MKGLYPKRGFLTNISAINEGVGKLASFLVVVIVIIISYEVIVRYAFNAPTQWVHEISCLLFIVYVCLGVGWTTVERRHATVDLVYAHFSPKGKAVARLCSSVIVFIFLAVLLWKGADWFWFAFQIKQCSHTAFAPPIWPVKLFLPLAAAVLLVIRVIFFAHDLAFIRRGGDSK